MAKIPYVGLNSPFGNRGPDRNTPMNADTRGIGSGLAEAAIGIARLGGSVVDAMQQHREQEAAIARANAVNNGLDDQIQLDAITDEHYQKLQSGEINWTDAEAKFGEAIAGRQIKEVPGLDEVGKINYQRLLERNAFQATQKWQTGVAGYKREYGASQVFGAKEKMLGYAATPNADPDAIVQQGAALRELWTGTGNKLDAFDKDHARFTADVYDKAYAARLNATIDNPEGLTKIREELSNEGYWGKRLGPEKANTAMAAIDRRIEGMKSDAERETRKMDKLAESLVGDVADQVEIGQNPSEERLLQARELAKGRPELQVRLQEAEQVGQVVNRLLAAPAVEQRGWIAKERARMDADGGTAEEYARLDKIDGTLQRRATARKNNPFGDPVLSPSANPLPMNDPNAMGIELNARMAASDAARQSNPDFGAALMRPEEAEQFNTMIKNATPAQMPVVLGGLYKSAGEKAYRRVMEQLGMKDPVMATAGIRFAVDLKAGRPPTVAVGIAKGRALLTAKDRTIVMPKDAEISDNFDTSVGQIPGLYANRPNDFRNDLQSVKAYYANATAEAGDVSGDFDQKRWNESIKSVLGEPVDFDGIMAFAPAGMEADRFQTLASREIDRLAKLHNFNTGFMAPDIGLRNVEGRPGYYYLVNDEGAMLKDKDGNLIGVNLND